MRKFISQLAEDKRRGVVYLPILALLRILSWAYGVLARFNSFLFDRGIKSSHRLPVPVLSVGNLTWGGTGKTPLVVWIAQLLQRENRKVAILTRGYMTNASVKSDEAELMQRKLVGVQVMVGKDRLENAQRFLKKNTTDVFLLDDGFQHRRVVRDLNIVTLDARHPFGNGALIPRGVLREPVAALRRADIIVLTRMDQAEDVVNETVEKIRRVNSRALLVKSIHRPTSLMPLDSGSSFDPSWIKGKRVFIFSGIGQPDIFKDMLVRLGAQVVAARIFADHHDYRKDEIDVVFKEASALNVDAIITTLKDAVKVGAIDRGAINEVKLFYLDIELFFTEGKDEFIQRIMHIVRR